MENKEEENYVSLRMAHGDIERAIHLLNLAKQQTGDTIKEALVQLCVIIYSRPFKNSHGIFQKQYVPLTSASIFPGGNSDHDAIISDRDQYIAHGDVTAYNPELHDWSSLDIFPIVQRPSHLYDRIDSLIEIMLHLCNITLIFLVSQIAFMEELFRKEILQKKEEIS
jgi:hypothetical protein